MANRQLRTKRRPHRPGLFADEFGHHPFGGSLIAAALNQGIKHKAVLFDGAPKPMFLAIDRDDNLVQMRFVAKPRRAAADLPAKIPPEFLGLMTFGKTGQ